MSRNDGGVRGRAVARRAVRRWSWRLLRREWRQQVLVIGLLTFAVAAAVFAATAAYNMASIRDADFGTADVRFQLGVADPGLVDPYVDAAQDWFGPVEVIAHRQVIVPGSTETVDLRAQEPQGRYSGPMLAVRSGRAPTAAGEVALTDDVAALFGVGVDGAARLGEDTFTVVGLVENPADLDDEFALLPPAAITTPESITILARGDEERVSTFRPAVQPGTGFFEHRGQTEGTTAAILVYAVAAVAMVLVSLVAGAAFVTLAHRRQRQLGMLAAVGATPRHLRRAMVANGSAIGAVAAVVGTVVAMAVWLVAAPRLESAASHRINRFDVPPWVPAAGALLAVLTATAAAWWPARAVSRVPVTEAISGRPPRPRATRRPLLLALFLLAAGIAGIASGIDPTSDDVVVYRFLPGLVATVAATVLLAGPALRAVARLAGRLPVAARLSVRDLARFQARSSAALGAISLGLAIAVAVVVIAAAAAPAADAGNLSDRQLIVWTSAPGVYGGLQVPAVTDDEVERLDAAVEELADTVGGATVVPLDVAVDPTGPEVSGGRTLLPIGVLGRRVSENTLRDAGAIFVANPALVQYLGLDPAVVDEDDVLVTSQPGEVYVTGNINVFTFRRNPVPDDQVVRVDLPQYGSAPRSVITEHGLDASGLLRMRGGWFLEAEAPLAAADLARARAMAAEAGLSVEVRDEKSSLTTVRTAASVAGVLVALAILAMTIGLLRSDASHDLRTLSATGATSRTRRALTASTACVLAIVGVVLGTVTSYAALIAGYWPETERLDPVPTVHLVGIALGLPVLATAISWLAAGRAPARLVSPRTD